MAGPVTREKFDGEVWSSDNVGDSGHLIRPDAATIAAGHKPAGVKPTRKYFNWLTNALASSVAFFENEGFFEWDQDISYEPNAIVRSPDTGELYVGKTSSNNNNNPVGDLTNWNHYEDAVSPGLSGTMVRPSFISTATSQIIIEGPGSYFIYGLGRISIDGTINYNFSSLTDGYFSYLYIDRSTLTGPGKISSVNLTDSQTPPSYSIAKGGWYNGDDRCIMGVKGSLSAPYINFKHDNERVQVESSLEVLGQVVTSTPVSIVLEEISPAFVSEVELEVELTRNGADTVLFVNPTGFTANNRISQVNTSVPFDVVVVRTSLNSSRSIDFTAGAGGNGLVTANVNSWYFPRGM